MKTSLFTLALVSLAGMLVAVETNFYFNSDFKNKTDKKGKFIIQDHWYEGKASVEGTYEGSPVLRLEQVNVKWGGFNCAALVWANVKRDLKPGKYTFSVWCKPEGAVSSVSILYNLLPAGQEKRVRKMKSYKGADLPPVGKWTELVVNFEIKPGDSKQSFGFSAHSTKAVGPKVILFAKPRITPEND